MRKDMHEDFTLFFEAPTRDGFARLVASHSGEMDFLDFKGSWPEYPEVARHMLAFANGGGGAIVVGVSENPDGTLSACGIDTVRDKADIDKGLRRYFPPSLEYTALDFSYKSSEYGELEGRSFQVLLIESDARKLPYQAVRGGTGVLPNVIYVRRGTESAPADHDELERLLNRRIDSGYSSTSVLKLEEHLEQLKTLYGEVPQTRTLDILSRFALGIGGILGGTTVPNPNAPQETYEEYVAGLIERKKRKIEQVLDIGE